MMIIWRFSTRPFISYSPYTPAAVSGGATWRSIRQQAGVLYAIPVIELWVKRYIFVQKTWHGISNFWEGGFIGKLCIIQT